LNLTVAAFTQNDAWREQHLRAAGWREWRALVWLDNAAVLAGRAWLTWVRRA